MTHRHVYPLLTSLAIGIVAVSVTAYVGRIELHNASLRGCERGALDRWDDYRVLRAQAHGDSIIANDPNQPKPTREARRVQAAAEMLAAADKRRRTEPTVRGRAALCRVFYPAPSPLG